jgi:hypothetical protein
LKYLHASLFTVDVQYRYVPTSTGIVVEQKQHSSSGSDYQKVLAPAQTFKKFPATEPDPTSALWIPVFTAF